MSIAMEYELDRLRETNTQPKDKSGAIPRLGYDIDSGDRKIEVKSETKPWARQKTTFKYLTANEKQNATHLYLVCNIENNPELKIIDLGKVPKEAWRPETKYALKMAWCHIATDE